MHYTVLMGWASFAAAFGVLALTGAPPRGSDGIGRRVLAVFADPSILIVLGMAVFGLAAVASSLGAALADPGGLLEIGGEGSVALAIAAFTLWRMFR